MKAANHLNYSTISNSIKDKFDCVTENYATMACIGRKLEIQAFFASELVGDESLFRLCSGFKSVAEKVKFIPPADKSPTLQLVPPHAELHRHVRYSDSVTGPV